MNFFFFLYDLGGLGTLTDGDTTKFLRWSRSTEPIFLLFAFDSIKEFQSISLDLQCSLIFSSSCTLKINVGIFEIVTSNKLWTTHFHPIKIDHNQYNDNTTISHLVLSVSKAKGQFIIIQIDTKDGLALSEVTFKHRNDNDNKPSIVPSSIYIEANLDRLESLALNPTPNEMIRK